MIKHLLLTHFVLVKKAEITFSPHFNIVTGETGAGKTAIIEAISLALGARADTSLIRQGNDRAIVEAVFDISALGHLQELSEEGGIPCADGELIIRREISREGKNRAYVNCHPVPLPFLQKIGNGLIAFIGQHAILELRQSEFQRSLIDLYIDSAPELSPFQQAHKKAKLLKARLAELSTKEAERSKNEDFLRFQLQEIDAVSLKEGEDEELFAQYQRLIHAQEIGQKLKEILERLSDSPSSVILQTNRSLKLIESLQKIDTTFTEGQNMLQQAILLLQEVHLQCSSYFDGLDQDPGVLNHLETRLSLIGRLKKKYGATVSLIQEYKQKLQAELSEFENLSLFMEETQKELEGAEELANQLAKTLSAKRKKGALALASLLSQQLQSLNMSKAEVQIEILPTARTLEGDDEVQFWLKANAGEKAALVREHSSGGELSRLFLAITLALAERNKTPTLIFDEIDANVGGKTASIIGEKLAELGKTRQVICITHFPQVAAKASCHFSVQKEEKEGRTITQIYTLSKPEKEAELLRMLGGDLILSTETTLT